MISGIRFGFPFLRRADSRLSSRRMAVYTQLPGRPRPHHCMYNISCCRAYKRSAPAPVCSPQTTMHEEARCSCPSAPYQPGPGYIRLFSNLSDLVEISRSILSVLSKGQTARLPILPFYRTSNPQPGCSLPPSEMPSGSGHRPTSSEPRSSQRLKL